MLAKSPDRLLVDIPEVRTLFGSMFWELEDRGGGWQHTRVVPNQHEWPTVGAGLDSLVAATGAPVLAAWVSESSCARIVAMTPSGRGWARHLRAYQGTRKGECGYDHWRFATLRLAADEGVDDNDTRTPQKDLLAWADEAGLPADRAAVAKALAATDLDGHDRVEALVQAVGAPYEAEIPRLFDHQDPAWSKTFFRAQMVAMRACRRWTTRREEPHPDDAERPWDAQYLDFLGKACAAVYGTGMTHAALVALSRALDDRWAAEIARDRD